MDDSSAPPFTCQQVEIYMEKSVRPARSIVAGAGIVVALLLGYSAFLGTPKEEKSTVQTPPDYLSNPQGDNWGATSEEDRQKYVFVSRVISKGVIVADFDETTLPCHPSEIDEMIMRLVSFVKKPHLTLPMCM